MLHTAHKELSDGALNVVAGSRGVSARELGFSRYTLGVAYATVLCDRRLVASDWALIARDLRADLLQGGHAADVAELMVGTTFGAEHIANDLRSSYDFWKGFVDKAWSWMRSQGIAN